MSIKGLLMYAKISNLNRLREECISSPDRNGGLLIKTNPFINF